MEKIGTIYKIENVLNKKVYIGQSNGDGWSRWNNHLSRLRRNVHNNSYLQNAFNKHGEDAFVFSICGKHRLDELDEIETEMILRQKRNKKSYNIENGGKVIKKIDDSTKEKISKKLSRKYKEDKEFKRNHLKVRARKIICLNNMKIYNSITEASDSLGADYQNIWQVLKGNNSYAKGKNNVLYQFRYYENNKKYKMKKVELNSRTIKRDVICINTGEVFDDVKVASSKYKVSESNILRCCRRERRFSGRLDNGDWIVWRYLDEYDKNESIPMNKKGANSHRSKPVICVTTGEFFENGNEACKKYKMNNSNLSQVLKGNRNFCGTLKDGTKLEWKYA